MSNIVGGFDLNKIPEPVKQAAIAKVEEYFGLTHAQAAENIAKSKAEAEAGDGETDFRGDAIGKFKHDLRRKIGGAIDAVWGGVEPIAAQLVDDVLAHAAP